MPKVPLRILTIDQKQPTLYKQSQNATRSHSINTEIITV